MMADRTPNLNRVGDNAPPAARAIVSHASACRACRTIPRGDMLHRHRGAQIRAHRLAQQVPLRTHRIVRRIRHASLRNQFGA
jgi:hypothetical protein